MKSFVSLTFLVFISFCSAQEPSDKSFLFISDTQQPLWIETFRLEQHDNETATQKLFSAMAKESSAVALFHLGDITGLGMINSSWRSFDTLRTLLNFPVYPAYGNHEYFFIASLGKEQTLKRFPFLDPSWYVRRIGYAAIIILNSNFSKLSDSEIAKQDSWYRAQLTELENDSTVKAIIVGCHHSPYTNSTIVNSDKEVQRRFVPSFKQCAKTILFISGHAHTYEHFHFDNKDFLVIGGGGGLQHPLQNAVERQWNDISSPESQRRFFHYVRCDVRKNDMLLQIKMLKNDFSGFEVVDEISIPYPPNLHP